MLFHPLFAFDFKIIEAFERSNQHVDVTRLLSQYVIPHISTFAEEVVRLHFIHASSAVLNPFAMLAWFVVVRNLEFVERILDVVKFVVCGVPFPLVWETDLMPA